MHRTDWLIVAAVTVPPFLVGFWIRRWWLVPALMLAWLVWMLIWSSQPDWSGEDKPIFLWLINAVLVLLPVTAMSSLGVAIGRTRRRDGTAVPRD